MIKLICFLYIRMQKSSDLNQLFRENKFSAIYFADCVAEFKENF